MKLISLNTWCGKMYEPLIDFIEHHSKDTDIFCFQEIRNGEYVNQPEEEGERINLYSGIEMTLPGFKGYYTSMAPGVGVAVFVRDSIDIESVVSTPILATSDLSHMKRPDGSSYYPRLVQSIHLSNPNIIIHNFHGVPGASKKDTNERNLQTQRLLDVLNKNTEPQIIVGDFNLDIDTNAIELIGKDLRNLVKESDYKKTRNANYKDVDIMPFADYAFVSKNIEVVDFKVLEDEVSDHLALLLEFK